MFLFFTNCGNGAVSGVYQYVLLSINFLFFMRVFHAAISVSALISRAEAVISEQENFWPFSVKT